MNKTTEAAIRAHAVEQYPRECCGLVVVVKGRERYIHCRNTATTPSEHFMLAPEDYANAEDMGEIVSVVHSHPDVPARPSEADLVACEASGLPWHIVTVSAEGAGEIRSFEPSGFQAPLVGRQFAHGITDCYTLVRDWHKREHGIELPDFERRDDWWSHGEDLYMQQFAQAGFSPTTGEPRPGDCFLMQIRAPVANHAAVYLGDGVILQHLHGRLSSRDVYSGYFQEVTRLRVRHKDLP